MNEQRNEQLNEHLRALDATLNVLEQDEYVKFKFGVSLKGARKALDKLAAGDEVPIKAVLESARAAREALDRAITQLEKGGGAAAEPKRRRAQPLATPGAVTLAPGSAPNA